MKKSLAIIMVPGLLLASNGSAFGKPDPAYCGMVATLARGITEERDRGVSYSAALGKIKGASQDLQSSEGILIIAKAALKTVYLDMPKLTPEGAYMLHFAACISAK